MGGTAELCDQQGIAFIQVVAESMGGWHKVATGHGATKKARFCLGKTHWTRGGRDHRSLGYQGFYPTPEVALLSVAEPDTRPPST